MNIKETIKILNQMVTDRVIDRYAIGGAVAATFYTEPFHTIDLDIFVMFAQEEGAIITLNPINKYLENLGFKINLGGYFEIHGNPVQFLPVSDPLTQEALENSVSFDLEGVSAPVFSVEHLAAISFRLGRAKDKARLPMLLESKYFNEGTFSSILERYGMTDNWMVFKRSFID